MGNQFERFTREARHSLQLSEEVARLFHHTTIDTEHILIGLIREEHGIAGYILRDLGLDDRNVMNVAKKLTRVHPSFDQPQIQISAQVKHLLEIAVDKAVRYGHFYVGTAHLLVAITHQSESVAIEILKRLGISLESMWTENHRILQVLAPSNVEQYAASGTEPAQISSEQRLQTQVAEFEKNRDKFDILARAGWESQLIGQQYIGSGHMLLALLRMKNIPEMKMLDGLHITPSRIQQEILRLSVATPSVQSNDINVLPEASHALSLACIHAQYRKDYRHVLTHDLSDEDILFGLVKSNGWAIEVLKQLGDDNSEVHDKIEHMLQQILNRTAHIAIPRHLKTDQGFRHYENRNVE